MGHFSRRAERGRSARVGLGGRAVTGRRRGRNFGWNTPFCPYFGHFGAVDSVLTMFTTVAAVNTEQGDVFEH